MWLERASGSRGCERWPYKPEGLGSTPRARISFNRLDDLVRPKTVDKCPRTSWTRHDTERRCDPAVDEGGSR